MATRENILNHLRKVKKEIDIAHMPSRDIALCNRRLRDFENQVMIMSESMLEESPAQAIKLSNEIREIIEAGEYKEALIKDFELVCKTYVLHSNVFTSDPTILWQAEFPAVIYSETGGIDALKAHLHQYIEKVKAICSSNAGDTSLDTN